MRATASTAFLLGIASMVRADKYGYNHVTVRQDSEVVAGAFKDVDIELLSPAFVDTDVLQPGFSDGTQGPSSQDDMGEYQYDLKSKTYQLKRDRGLPPGAGRP